MDSISGLRIGERPGDIDGGGLNLNGVDVMMIKPFDGIGCHSIRIVMIETWFIESIVLHKEILEKLLEKLYFFLNINLVNTASKKRTIKNQTYSQFVQKLIRIEKQNSSNVKIEILRFALNRLLTTCHHLLIVDNDRQWFKSSVINQKAV